MRKQHCTSVLLPWRKKVFCGKQISKYQAWPLHSLCLAVPGRMKLLMVLRKVFFQCLPSSLSYIYMFVCNTVCLTSGMFRNYRFSDIGDSLRTLLTKPLYLKSLLSFRWRKRNLFMVVLLLLFFPQMFSNQSRIRCTVSQSILQNYSDIMRKKHGIYCFSIWVWEMRYCFQLFIIKQYKCLVIPFCTLCNANMSVAIWHS